MTPLATALTYLASYLLSMVQRYSHLSPGHRQRAIERLVSRTVDSERGQDIGTPSHQE